MVVRHIVYSRQTCMTFHLETFRNVVPWQLQLYLFNRKDPERHTLIEILFCVVLN